VSVGVVSLEIADIKLVRPTRHHDDRGYFVESYNEEDFKRCGVPGGFVQDNESLSLRRGTVRGLHFQAPPHAQAKLVRVIHGAIFDVAVDLRIGSPTYGEWCHATLTADDGAALYIPRGFAHGFCTLEANTMVSYKVDDYYSRQCEDGIFWNDPDLAINWPVSAAEACLCDKDEGFLLLRNLVSPFTFQP
jgi:dTDP-4-dehydrorhamnose 3,5-epimerase